MQSQQLPTESQVFEEEILAGTERADHPAEEISERHEHAKNLIGTVRIQRFPKSFILRVYDVLARHRSRRGAFNGLPADKRNARAGSPVRGDANTVPRKQTREIESG